MEIDITFRDGPIDAKISATEEESYIEVLEELGEFVEGYDLAGYQIQKSARESNPGKQGGNSDDNIGLKNGSAFTEPCSQEIFVEGVDATESELLRVFKLGSSEGEEIEEFPEILGTTDLLGDTIQDRLLNGSIVLLTILEDVHGITKVRTTELVEALGTSGLNNDNWKNIGQAENVDVYLNRHGSGKSATTELRDPGKEDAYRHIEALVDDIRESEDPDGEQTTL